jgi:uncharacterized protein
MKCPAPLVTGASLFVVLLMYMSGHLIVRKNKLGEQGLFAGKKFKKGEIVLKLVGQVNKKPTKYSIEVGENEHITDELGKYLNHSCDPNTKVEREKRVVSALRDITSDEELSFDYNENETKMADPFMCQCGSPNCRKFIGGKNRTV